MAWATRMLVGVVVAILLHVGTVEGPPALAPIGPLSKAQVATVVSAWMDTALYVALTGCIGLVVVHRLGCILMLVGLGMDTVWLLLLPMLRADGERGWPWLGLAVWLVAAWALLPGTLHLTGARSTDAV